MLALLIFVVCAFAGSVVLSAGTASAGRMAGIGNTNQAVYTLTSTAEVMKQCILDSEYTPEENVTDYSNSNAVTTSTSNKLLTSSLCKLSNQVSTTRKANPDSVFTKSLNFATTLVGETEEPLGTEVTMTMDQDYNITIQLKTENDNEEVAQESTLTLTAVASMYVHTQAATPSPATSSETNPVPLKVDWVKVTYQFGTEATPHA